MGIYVLKRILSTVLMVWVVATILFLFVHMIPGDPAVMILGGSETFQPSEAQLQKVREDLGLDKPLHIQYGTYIANLVQGDMGASFLTKRPVATELSSRFWRTVQLVLPALIIAAILGVLLGVWAAKSESRIFDAFLNMFALLGHSVPSFVIASLLVLLFAIQLKILPSSGYIEWGRDSTAALKFMVLPVMTLVLGRVGSIMRMTRMSMKEEAGADYSRTARAKGVSERSVTFRHQLKNAALPVVTIIGLQMGGMFAGAVIIESVFNWPGLNRMLLTAVTNRDYPLLQGSVLLTSAVYMFVTLLTDLTYSVLNPRIRYG